jgi:MoxR-like ATPase
VTVPPPAGPTGATESALATLRDRVAVEVARVIVGQDEVVDLLLAAAVVGGHVLLEGVPGVAKTLLARAWAAALGLDFRRVQFTPDMLPSDLSGTVTLRFDPAHTGGDGGGRQDLAFRPGPVFTNVLLADEINRTPPKTQAALLEAMQEAQVSVDGVSHPLPQPFLVVATQNPIEYEGTYPLPEAQLDRFLLKINVGYPSAAEEEAILRLGHRGVTPATLADVAVAGSPADIAAAQAEVDATSVADEVAAYVVAVVRRTRELPSVALGGSPRAAVHLLAAAKAAARLRGRAFVTPDDVAAMAAPVLRHRLVLRPEAELERYRPDDAITAALASVPVPR